LTSENNSYTFIKLVSVRYSSFIAKVTRQDGKVFALKFYHAFPASFLEKELLDKLNLKNCANILLHNDFHNNKWGYFFVFPWIKEKVPPNEFPALWFFIKDVATAIAGCHTNNIVHCDIKPSNILTSLSNDVYLCDFESAREPELDDPFTGTTMYWSPEVCKREPSAQDFPRDVWAFGVVIIETVYKTYPFAKIDMDATDNENATSLLDSYKQFLSIKTTPGLKELDIPKKWSSLILEKNLFWPDLLPDTVSTNEYIHHILLQRLLKKILTLDPKCRCTIFQALEYINEVVELI